MTSETRTNRRVVLAAAVAGATAGCLGRSDGRTPTAGEASRDGGDGSDPADEEDTTPTPVASLPPPTLGEPDAEVTVAAFEDYACPHCRRFHLEVLPRIESEYVEEGVVRYEHRDFPIPVDRRWSWAAAGAARAVQDTAGDGAFFEYARSLFENQGDYSLELVESLARGVGADPEPVVTAAREGTYRPVLEADRQRGRDLDLEGTPTVFVAGSPTENYAYETVAAAVEAARDG